MSLKSRNRHYHWSRIEPRHFRSTARHVGFSEVQARRLIEEVTEQTDLAIEAVVAQLPGDFPPHISEPILEGVRAQARKLQIALV